MGHDDEAANGSQAETQANNVSEKSDGEQDSQAADTSDMSEELDAILVRLALENHREGLAKVKPNQIAWERLQTLDTSSAVKLLVECAQLPLGDALQIMAIA